MSKAMMFLFYVLLSIVGCILIAGCDEALDPEMDTTQSDTDTDSDSDGDTGTEEGNDPDDTDDDTGTGSDTGEGGIDWDPDANCDCSDATNTTAENLAAALNICPNAFFVSATKWSSAPSADSAYGIMESMGNNDCLEFQHGCLMTVLSTGPVGQSNPNLADGDALGSGSSASTSIDPLPAYQGESPTTSAPYSSCDVVQLKLSLKSPPGADGFSFDFLYASAEYNEWINMGYNDAFYAILEYDGLNSGQETNISFDDNGNEIEVDTNFFENVDHTCDESGSGWEPAISSVSGSTGWLRTTWPIPENTNFDLTFSIHDEGDCVYDSAVFLDNFQWAGEPVEPGTGPV